MDLKLSQPDQELNNSMHIHDVQIGLDLVVAVLTIKINIVGDYLYAELCTYTIVYHGIL